MVQIWNDSDWVKPKYLEKTLSEYHFIHHKSHNVWPWIDTYLPGWKVAIIRLSHGRIFLFQRSSSFPLPLFPPSPPFHPVPPSPFPPHPFSSTCSCTLQPFKFGLMTNVHSVESNALVQLFYSHTPQVQFNIVNPINLSLTSPSPGLQSSIFLKPLKIQAIPIYTL